MSRHASELHLLQLQLLDTAMQTAGVALMPGIQLYKDHCLSLPVIACHVVPLPVIACPCWSLPGDSHSIQCREWALDRLEGTETEE